MVYFILLILMFFSAFFSSLETGLLALGEVKINKWAKVKIKSLDTWINDPAGIVTGILIGNNLVNISFSAVFTVLVVHFTKSRWAELISIVCSSFAILILGEILPKTFANTHPDKVVKIFYVPFMKFYGISKRVIDFLNKTAGIMKMKREKLISRKEVRMAMKEVKADGILEEDLSSMLGRVLFLTQKTVGEVMIPRKTIYALDLNREYENIIKNLLSCHYSRIPAYYKRLDNLRGVIYIKDVIGELNHSGKIDFNKILRKPHITYPGRNCQHLFHELISGRTHCSIVKSNKRVIGFITVEDLIEEIVGEIYDEYDCKYNFI